ncbi:MAG: lamin tail domain-containing protein [Proteobacteria bacterium]|nr:lamin tail domain-containing protein [Pseudomonadota bacterium]MCP4921218.1 lamin tail domain-containing protein [Pseudomonadota bacterium]
MEEPEDLARLVVNEVSLVSDQIELFNGGTETIDLFEYEITDHADEDVLAWRLPQVELAPGEYLVIEADGTGDGLHTDFMLSADETVTLWTNKGVFADSLEVYDTDEAWARVPDGWTSMKEQPGTFGETNGE